MNLLPLILPAVMLSGGVSYNYDITPYGTAVITAVNIYDGSDDITIPELIDGYTVTEIGNNAFIGRFSLRKITIPDTVTSIGNSAFMSCTSLTEVTIGNGVTVLPDDCFFSCTALETVNLPETLKTIGDDVFFGCDNLDLYIPQSVENIGSNAFGIHIDPHSGEFVSVYGFLVKGVSGSNAERYAVENSIDFIDMNNYLLGDVNNDGFVDAIDASNILEEYSKVSTGSPTTFTKKKKIMSDINYDGIIDAVDASSVLSIYAKLSTKF
ncbi:MAG: leucine-rich repeat protein [Ruminococcus sp.]|nr:leucine-rich repeat protein [Ruminococcus sp.]MDE7104369.1 leucine-rich repeat protein [Ruminococcus sp.]